MKLKHYLTEYSNEKKMNKLCEAISKEYNCKITHFRDIKELGRGSYSYIPGYGDRSLWEQASSYDYIDENGMLIEGISPEQFGLDKYKGGVIVFSTDVNAVDVSKSKIKNWMKSKYRTILNRVFYGKKVSDIITKKFSEIGAFSIGNAFRGRYVSDGRVFNEKSVSLEVLGVPSDVLMRLAATIAKDFTQETVLLKDYNTGRNILIDKS